MVRPWELAVALRYVRSRNKNRFISFISAISMAGIAIAVLVLIVSGPSVLIAWLKLRKRNLGPILDANGWAVNARARLNVPFGESLTGIAKLPRGARIVTRDRFGQRPAAWPRLVAFLIVLGFIYSLLNDYGLIRRWTGGLIGDEAGARPGIEVLLTPNPTDEAEQQN